MYEFENEILDFFEGIWFALMNFLFCDIVNRIGLFRDDINIYFMTFILYLPPIIEIMRNEV